MEGMYVGIPRLPGIGLGSGVVRARNIRPYVIAILFFEKKSAILQRNMSVSVWVFV